MKTTSTVSVRVEGGGDQVVSHVGLHALGSFADRMGLGSALSERFRRDDRRVLFHDRGKVLTQALLMLAAGGQCCADIEYLRPEYRLFGSVASDSTLYRTVREVGPDLAVSLREAISDVRADVWQRSNATTGDDDVVLDIDASLVEIHSENKENTGPTYKGGFGFHPMLCFADATGETLGAMLRPGQAGANSAEDHLSVLDAAVVQLPPDVAVGHRENNDKDQVQRQVVVRADSAGATYGFVSGCRVRNISFAVAARSTKQIHVALSKIVDDENKWTRALDQNGDVGDHGHVAEITGLVDLSRWPSGTRLIIRREPLHPGAQQTLFPSLEYRYWGHYTDQLGPPQERDVFMRAHAHVEDHIGRLKDAGLLRFPFSDIEANKTWLMLVCLSADLVRWFQLLCCTGELQRAEPKSLRWKIWHAPARVVRKAGRDVVRILDGWPATNDILRAYKHIEMIT